MHHTEQAKEEMVNECRLSYENNIRVLEKINTFHLTYTSDQVIKWYTADSFVYRLLNRALRYYENFDVIFKFRYLTNLMNYFMDDTFYEVKDIVLGKFLIYMGKYEEAANYFKDIYNRYRNDNQSLFYLFDFIMGLGSVFHSTTNYSQAEELYKTALKNRQYQTSLNYLKCQNQLGKLYIDMGNYSMAVFYFNCVLDSLQDYKQKNQKTYYLLLAQTYINMASLHLEADNSYKSEPEKVFKLLSLAKEIYEKILPRNHPLFAELHYYFGWAYYVENNTDSRVLENLQHAMNIQVLSLPKNHIQRVPIHFRLGQFYFAQKKYSEGLNEFGQIIDIHFELLSELDINHPLVARTFDEIGAYYQEMNRPMRAFLFFRLAFKLTLNEELKGLLELKIEVCKMVMKEQMHIFDLNSLFSSSRENNHDIRQQEILFYQDDNENILDIASELYSTGVHFSNFGRKLSFDKTLTLQQMRTLCDFMRNGSDIQELVFFSGPCENEAGLIYFADALAINDTIKELYISQTLFRSQKVSKNVCQVFARAIEVNTILTDLTLNKFSNHQMTLLLFDALSKHNHTLVNLSISEIKVSNKAAQHLGEMLKRNKVITKISLTHTKLTSAGSEFIASGLEINESLTYLDLSNNKIRSSGFCALGNALKLNKTLSTLYLTHNKTNSSGVHPFGEALSVNRSLKILHLYDNYIDCIGATYIANGLKNNETLTKLSLSSNRISSVGAAALADSLRQRPTVLQNFNTASYRVPSSLVPYRTVPSRLIII
ncbi:unnamed protein product [Adineta ricciae]|uniref:Uncharacterized protein n=1 Tax=Adineta ricciae TaxID=249248 RepID=A0A815Q4A7_ADIRI|nr:unnamed protein product [Adineta ricciae]CAF1663722.1 unnamed protein product [Adineta ricciae]